MDILKLIEFKNWADDIYLDYCSKLSDEQYTALIPGYNRCIKDLLAHMAEVYFFWYEFINEKDEEKVPEWDKLSFKEISSIIKDLNSKFISFISNKSINKNLTIQWDKSVKPVITNPENVLFNYVTHSAYHRGQIAVLLKYFGVENLKETDYNPYIYELGQK